MEEGNYCFICQDFEENVGHAAKWCPKIVCQKCGQKGHVKMGCMFGLEDFPLPNEIVLQILSYLQGVQRQKFMFQFALTYRNIQARFGLRGVVWES